MIREVEKSKVPRVDLITPKALERFLRGLIVRQIAMVARATGVTVTKGTQSRLQALVAVMVSQNEPLASRQVHHWLDRSASRSKASLKLHSDWASGTMGPHRTTLGSMRVTCRRLSITSELAERGVPNIAGEETCRRS